METPSSGTPESFPKQVYIWSNRTFEGNIYVEFEWKALKPNGLSLLMIHASGMTREDFMADYPKKTSGTMNAVHNENVRNYHWEYYREMNTLQLSRRHFLTTGLTAASAATLGFRLSAAEATGFSFDPSTDIIKAPQDPQLWPEFRAKLAAWRSDSGAHSTTRMRLYRRPDFAWVAGSFACCFLMLCDERFYDAANRRYRIKEWLEASQRDFGGFDSAVLWHAYPRIGLDERNQFDFYRDQPGGLKGLREVVDELHRAGVRTYIDYNPWDTVTRREDKSDVDALCEIVRALDVDGIFLDTMKEGAAEFRAKLDAVRPGVVLEGEIALPMARIADHHMAWAQGFKDSEAPGVVRNKWFERRHQLHHVSRWHRDRTAEFQTAFMNGTGTMIWDNVFGTWVGYSEREKSILRAMLPIQRRFTSLFSGERWTPLVPTSDADLYASLWEDEGIRLWTLVNRSTREIKGGPAERRT